MASLQAFLRGISLLKDVIKDDAELHSDSVGLEDDVSGDEAKMLQQSCVFASSGCL
jgi:hypothetical protein